MNQAKQCKCQAIFGHLIELLFFIRDMQASVSPHPITFLVVAFLKIIHANWFYFFILLQFMKGDFASHALVAVSDCGIRSQEARQMEDER
jgi:hypothetical protein